MCSLPFKGRVGVGMGYVRYQWKPIPILSFPLKGKGPAHGAFTKTARGNVSSRAQATQGETNA